MYSADDFMMEFGENQEVSTADDFMKRFGEKKKKEEEEPDTADSFMKKYARPEPIRTEFTEHEHGPLPHETPEQHAARIQRVEHRPKDLGIYKDEAELERFIKPTLGEKAITAVTKIPVIGKPIEETLQAGGTFYGNYWSSLSEYAKDLQYLTSRLGENPLSQLFAKAGNKMEDVGREMKDMGLDDGLISKVVGGFGGAAGSITRFASTPGMGITLLPAHGAVTGARGAAEKEGKIGEKGVSLKQLAGTVPGIVEGFLMHGLLKGTGELTKIPRTIANVGIFTGVGLASGKDFQEAFAEGLTMGGLGLMPGGKKGQSIAELKRDFYKYRNKLKKKPLPKKTFAEVEPEVSTFIQPEWAAKPTEIKTEPIQKEYKIGAQDIEIKTAPEIKPKSIADLSRELIAEEATQMIKPITPGVKPVEIDLVPSRKPQQKSGILELERTSHPIREASARKTIEKFGAEKLTEHITKRGITNDSMNVVAGKMANKLIKEGKVSEAMKVADRALEFGRGSGQEVESFKHWKNTPAGALKDAKMVIDKMRTPKQELRAKAKSAEIKKRVRTINKMAVPHVVKDVAQEVAKKIGGVKGPRKPGKPKTPEGSLAKRIIGAASDTKKKFNPVKDMVNTLFRVAKQSIPNKVRNVRNPTELIEQAIINKGEFENIYKKAKRLVLEKHGEKMAERVQEKLTDYFEYEPGKFFPDAMVNKKVSGGIKDLEINLGKLVKRHYSEVKTQKESLQKKLMSEFKINEADALELESLIGKRFEELTASRKRSELKKAFRKRTVTNKNLIDRIVETSNLGAFEDTHYHELISEKYKMPYLDVETAKKIAKIADELQGMEPGRDRWIKESELVDLAYSRKGKAPLWQKAAVVETMAMLLNLKTIGRNIAVNALYSHMDMVNQATSGLLIDKLIGKFTKQRSVSAWTPKQFKIYTKEYVTRFAKEFKDVLDGVNISSRELKHLIGPEGEGILKKHQILRGVAGQHDIKTGVLESKAGKLGEKALALGLRVDDRARFFATFKESLHNMMNATKTIKPTPEMFDQAVSEGLARTFQDINVVSRFALDLKKNFNKVLPYSGELLLKFPKTPASLFVRGVEMSPLGLIRAAKVTLEAIRTKDFTTQRQASLLAGRAVTGTGLFYMAYALALKGVITGPGDIGKRGAFDEAKGKRRFSVNTSAVQRYVLSGFDSKQLEAQKGDKFVSYDWIQPVSLTMSLGADLAKRTKQAKLDGKKPNMVNMLVGSYAATVTSLAKQDFMRNLTNSFSSYGSPDQKLTKILQNVPQRFVPSIAKQIRYALDPTMRHTRDEDKNFINEAWNGVKNSIPGLSKTLPAKRDVFGDKIDIYDSEGKSGAEKIIDIMGVFASPVIVKKYRTSPGIRFIEGLYEKTGDARVLPRQTTYTKEITYKGKKFPLSMEKRMEYQRLMGKSWGKIAAALARNRKFKALPPEEQIKLIYGALNKMGKEIRESFLKEIAMGLFRERK